MKLSELPIYQLPEPERKRNRQKTMDMIVDHGRCCRRAGYKIEQCPDFVDPDMTASWRMGWHQQDRAVNDRKKQPRP